MRKHLNEKKTGRLNEKISSLTVNLNSDMSKRKNKHAWCQIQIKNGFFPLPPPLPNKRKTFNQYPIKTKRWKKKKGEEPDKVLRNLINIYKLAYSKEIIISKNKT